MGEWKGLGNVPELVGLLSQCPISSSASKVCNTETEGELYLKHLKSPNKSLHLIIGPKSSWDCAHPLGASKDPA